MMKIYNCRLAFLGRVAACPAQRLREAWVSVTWVLLCTLFAAQNLWAESELTLVRDGQATSVIIIPASPNESAVYGAKELQLHLKKITGAEIPIITDREKADAGKVQILVGESRATRALGLTTADFKPQEYALKFLDNAIVLFGHDETKYPVEEGRSLKSVPGKFGKGVDGWCCIGVTNHCFSDEQGTMEAFIYRAKATNETSTGGIIFRIGDDNNHQSVVTEANKVTKDNDYVYETVAGGQTQKVGFSAATLKPGWHHLMATWSASAKQQELFIDGKSVGSAPYVKTACSGTPCFGIRSGSDLIPFAWGPLDEVRVSKIVCKSVVPMEPFKTDDDTLILMHFDNKRCIVSDDSEYPRRSPNDPPILENVGSLYAVYDFLEIYGDVRWYFPGDWGMVCTNAKTFTVTGKDLRRLPSMLYRGTVGNRVGYDNPHWGGLMQQTLFNNASDDDIQAFSRRVRCGGRALAVNHCFYGYAGRYAKWKADPKDPTLKGFEDEFPYFASGKFMAQGRGDTPIQLCYSWTGTLHRIVEDANRYFDGGGTEAGEMGFGNIFDVAPDDDMGWCQCAECRSKVLWPDGAKGGEPKYMEGGESNASYYVWDFTRRVAEEVAKTHPDAYIGQQAYLDYYGFPRTPDGKPLKMPKNLLIQMDLGTRPRLELDPAKDNEIYQYKNWMKAARSNGWLTSLCLYQCFPNEVASMNNYYCWPGFHAHNLDQSMKMFVRDGVSGAWLCGMADYIDCYLTFKLMRDANFDMNKELDEFFTRFYGPAAKPVKAFYSEIEGAFVNPTNYPGGNYMTQELAFWNSMGTPPRMKRLASYIKEAHELAGKDELIRKRVDLLDRGVWGYMQQGYNQWTSKQAGGKHPYPLSVPDGDKMATMKYDAPFEKPGENSVYFRSGAGSIGFRDHRFDDEQGTVQVWIRCGPMQSNFCHGAGIVVEIDGEAPFSGHRLWVDTSKGVFVPHYDTWLGGITNSVVSQHAMATNEWHNLMITWNAKSAQPTMTLTVDGKPAGTKAYTKTACASATAFGIGGRVLTLKLDGGYSFGPLDELRLSNIVRKPSLPTTPYATDSNTLILLHFDEPEGTPYKDSSGVER